LSCKEQLALGIPDKVGGARCFHMQGINQSAARTLH